MQSINPPPHMQCQEHGVHIDDSDMSAKVKLKSMFTFPVHIFIDV